MDSQVNVKLLSELMVREHPPIKARHTLNIILSEIIPKPQNKEAKTMRKHLIILSGILLTAVTGIATGADTTVRILHLQDNPRVSRTVEANRRRVRKTEPGRQD